MSLFSSFGLKRYLASALTALAGILASDPNLVVLVPLVAKLAALLGLTGLVHAGKGGTLLTNTHLSLGALFPLLIAASAQIPALQSYTQLLTILGSLLGFSVISVQSLPKNPLAVLKLAVKNSAKKK